ncbi:sensor histidine kinase [Streptomyces sp. NPDC059740]|uniref:sensor histidine kinase n=1 Tax=Streptomyces sp. NPDC059740 TaxID=3346926 RepID=UPI00366506A5
MRRTRGRGWPASPDGRGRGRRRGHLGPPRLRSEPDDPAGWRAEQPAPAAEPAWRSRADRGGGLPLRSALVLTVLVQAASTWAVRQQPDRTGLGVQGRLLLFAVTAVLVLRHRYPRAVVWASAGLTLAYLAAGYPYGPVFAGLAFACFAAVVAGHRWHAWAAVGTVWAGHVLISYALYPWLPPPGDGAAGWTAEPVVAAWAAAVLAVSEFARVRREQRAQKRAERAAAERRRADEERLRIARELHDVLAHSISVINVQAGVGLALLDTDPEQTRAALTTIRDAGKEALGEVRQVLATLRAPGSAPRAPAPGLDRLSELTEQARAAGLTVHVTEEGGAGSSGGRGALPAGVDLAAFRIVQEGLTNVLRHSGARTAEVRLTHRPGILLVRVDDDGPATSGATGGGGNGVIGMRERATALGGSLTAGPRPGGGFRVEARLPVRRRGGAAGDATTPPKEEA